MSKIMDYSNGTAVRVRKVLNPKIHNEYLGEEGVVLDSTYYEATHMTDIKVKLNYSGKTVVFKQTDLELV